MKRILITILAIALGIALGLGIYFLFFKEDKVVNDSNTKIPDVSFTLNDIKEKFLATTYAKNNDCSVVVLENGLKVDCNKEYFFKLDGQILELELNEKDDKDIFKEMVKVIETFYDNSSFNYDETLNKFINKEASITNLEYKINGKKHILKVDTSALIGKYIEKETINNQEIITNRSDTSYKYEKGNYTIDDIQLIYDNDLNWLVYAAKLFGPDHKQTLNLKLYDKNNNILYEHQENLANLDDYGNSYLSFVINIELDKENIHNEDIYYYSISLE